MKRNQFLHLSFFSAIGISLLPQFLLGQNTTKFTRDFLIGKETQNFEGSGYKMHPQAHQAFIKMKAEAAKQGIVLEVVSAYRSFARQKQIFEGKYNRFTQQGMTSLQAIKKIIEYSTIPGTSRHHWGTDIDIIDRNGSPRPSSVLQAQHFHGEGPFCNMKEWMNKNASRFGFIEVYTNNAQRKGFKYEPWHFSYAPVSVPALKAYQALDIKEILLDENIQGAQQFTTDFLAQYKKEHVLDINPELLP